MQGTIVVYDSRDIIDNRPSPVLKQSCVVDTSFCSWKENECENVVWNMVAMRFTIGLNKGLAQRNRQPMTSIGYDPVLEHMGAH